MTKEDELVIETLLTILFKEDPPSKQYKALRALYEDWKLLRSLVHKPPPPFGVTK